MKPFKVSRLPSRIKLGYDGENNWRPKSFDCSTLLADHPNGIISLWLLPQGETQAFPVVLERDGNMVVWTPLSEEMTARTGALQIVCVDGTDVGKSAVVLWDVDESIVPGAEHPADVPSWATQVMEQYQDAVEHYPQIIDSTWHVWDVDNETWEDTGVSAQGVNGEDGHSPYIALNGHWMVYSDSTHEWIDTGVSASVDEAVIANAVAAYLEEHPITETDPTVPNWAKQPTKPTYTAQEVGALPANTPIPAVVTEQTVSGWGFTKNTGDYSKPSGGIPKSDLAQTVQDSLDNADSAYQKPSTGIPKSDLASDVQTSLGKADTALQQHQSLAGYATETWVGQQIANIPDELPTVTTTDNGKFLRVVSGAWAAESVPSYQGGSY